MRIFTRVLAAVAAVAFVLAHAMGIAGAAVTTPHLDYYGGRVLSHVKVDVVVWGSWSYPSTVPLTGHRSVASFVGGVTNSSALDWLSEYNTPSQRIGRGSLDGIYTVRPAQSANGAVVTDTQIRRSLSSLITSGRLPRPSVDRLLVLFFRKGQVISSSNGDSAHTFCAYHQTMTYASRPLYYAVIPYELSNPGCHVAASSFDRVTTIASHEVIEGITDPGVGLMQVAWYDRANGEIADICALTTPGYVTGGDGVRYMVQREWSNRRRACVLTS